MRPLLPMAAALMLIACSSAPQPARNAEAPPPPPVRDDTFMLPTEHRTAARVVPNHLLGKSVLPGGTIGDYDDGDRKYQLFIIETDSAQDAAIMLLDLKATLREPAYIAYMGGYFGTDAGNPVYVFGKGHYLAGVTGLAEDLADPIARQLAQRLR
jgi:hypothetical protein